MGECGLPNSFDDIITFFNSIMKNDLPDLKVVSVEQVAYSQEPALAGVEYPGKSTI